MWTKLRTVVLEQKAEAAVQKHTGNVHRFDEAFEGLEWFLAREPEVGKYQNVDGKHVRVYVQSGDNLAKTPDIWVVFEITDDEIIIYDIEIRPHQPDDI